MFQIVNLPTNGTTDAYAGAIRELVLANPGSPVTIASEFRPADNAFYRAVPDTRWTRIVRPLRVDGSGRFNPASAAANGVAMADEVAASLLGARGPTPARVMIDELSSVSRAHVDAFAVRMATHQAASPALQNRWGVFLVHGRNVSYAAYEPVLVRFMSQRAIITPELYASYSDYCRDGGDNYLRKFFFEGESARSTLGRRFSYLWQLAGRFQNPPQPLSVLFGVTDPHVGGRYPLFFIDRMFQVWMSDPRYRQVLSTANGGAGSWKWEWRRDVTFRVGSTTRDAAFRASWQWYGAGNTARRPGARAIIC